MNVKVTNYRTGLKAEPIQNVHKKAEFKLEGRELSINDALFVHVFDEIPQMRYLEVNKSWFQSNIYHL